MEKAEASGRYYLGPWRVDVNVRPGVVVPLARVALARAMATALRATGAPAPASIGLILSDDHELARLNRVALGRRGPTDVLSFPLLPPGAFPRHPGQVSSPLAAPSPPPASSPPEASLPTSRAVPSPAAPPPAASLPTSRAVPPFALPPGRRPHLGDVVVSVERAVAHAAAGRGGQSGTVRWPAADELRLLVIHGTLHVCGWDHAEPAEEAAMRELEREFLGIRAGELEP